MIERFKNLKVVKKLNETIGPKLRWLNYTNKTKNDKNHDTDDIEIL